MFVKLGIEYVNIDKIERLYISDNYNDFSEKCEYLLYANNMLLRLFTNKEKAEEALDQLAEELNQQLKPTDPLQQIKETLCQQ